MMILGSILGSLLAPSLLQLPGMWMGQPGAAPGNGVRDAVRGPYSRAVAKITEVKQTPSNYFNVSMFWASNCLLERLLWQA